MAQLKDDETKKKKKKKKSKSSEVSVRTLDTEPKKRGRGRPKGSKTKKRAPMKIDEKQSLFGDELPEIQKLLKQKENDGAISRIQKGMLESSLVMLPILEQIFYDKQTTATIYAFNNLVTSIRELIADLQATSDKAIVIDNLIHNVLQPQLLSFANFIVESNYELKKELKTCFKSSDRKYAESKIDESSKEAGKYAQEVANSLSQRITNILNE